MKKNKLVTATLATSLVLGSVAGLPLSDKGLAALGFGVAQAGTGTVSSGLPNQELKSTYASLHDALAADPADLAAVKAARTALDQLLHNDAATGLALTDSIWNQVSAKMGTNASNYPNLTRYKISEIMLNLLLTRYDANASHVDAIKNIYNPTLNELAKLGGLSGGLADVTYEDAVLFMDAVEVAVKAQIGTDVSTLASFLSKSAAEAKVKAAITDVMNQMQDGDYKYKFAKVLKGIGITSDDILEVKTKLEAAIDPQKSAEKALAAAYVRMETNFAEASTSSDGRTKTYNFTVMGIKLPGAVISWSMSENNKVTVTHDTAGNLSVSLVSGVSSATVTLTARDALYGKLIATKSVTLTTVSQGTTDPTPPTPTPPVDEVKGPDQAKALEQITANIDKIADLAKNPNAGNGLKKAQEAIQEAIREAAKVDVSATVKVENGVAKPNLDAKKISDVFKTVKEIAKSANDKLKDAVPDAKPAKVIATLDLGTVTAGTTQIPLSADILAAAKENGVEAIAVVVNGITLAIDVDQLAGATTINIKKEEKSVATSATQLNVASDVYEFNFESDGKKIENFSKPVEVKIPLPALQTGVDADLLVLAKIQDGKLIFKGGQYDASKKEFAAMNKSFSTYAVVENKVEFKDTAAVKDWAGRQIAVVAAKGIVEGRAAGQFVPEGNVTRAEFAKMIVKAYGLEDAAATESFADVNDSDWFKPYVAAAVKAELINGRSAASFDPNAEITRAEMAAIAARALTKVKEYKAAVSSEVLKVFKDAASINSTLTAGVALAAEQGIVVGDENKQFNPDGNTTRAEAAVVIYRMLNK